MSILPFGYGSPFIKVFYFKEGRKGQKDTFRPINSNYVATSLEYKYAEEEDDSATIIITTNDRTIADKAEFQKGAQLKLLWGYIGGPQCKAVSVYIRDVDVQFEDKVTLTLSCTDKGAYLKDNTSQQIHDAGTNNEDDKFTIFKLFADYCKKYNLQGHLYGKGFDYKINSENSVRPVNFYTDFIRPASYKDPAYPFPVSKVVSLPGFEPQKELPFDANRYSYYPQANKSDFQLLWELLQREQQGPWVLKGRGNTLEVAQRPLTNKPIKRYTWSGGSGELLGCHISDQGQVVDSGADVAATASWDPENKTFNYTLKDPASNEEDKLNELTSMDTALNILGNQQSIYWGSKVGAWILNKGAGSWALRGLTGYGSLGLAVAFEATVVDARKYKSSVETGVAQPFSGGYILNQIDQPKDATHPDGNPDATYIYDDKGGQIGVERKITLPGGGIIIKRIVPHKSGKAFKTFFDHEYNDVTFRADVEASKYNAIKNQDYAKLIDLSPNLSNMFRDLHGQNVRLSSQHDPAIAEAEAANEKANNALEKIKISASAIGDPKVTDMQVITILGIGNKYSGNYYTKKVIHKVDPGVGYIMTLDEMVSNSIGPTDDNDNTLKNQQLPGEINIIIAEEAPNDTYRVTATDSGSYSTGQ